MKTKLLENKKCILSENEIILMVNNLRRRPILKSNFRVYNGTGHRDYSLEILLYHDCENFKTLMDIELFFKKNNCVTFGIVINDCNELIDFFDSDFYNWQLNNLKNYFYSNENNDKLIDFVLFIGNYGYTPFGIHNDIGDHLITQQLLYGKKEMYIFDNDYKIKTEGVNSYAIGVNLEYANKYTLFKGDIISFNGDNYHIGKANDLSVGLTVGLAKNSKMINTLSKIVLNDSIQNLTDDYKKNKYITQNISFEDRLNHIIRQVKSNNFILNKYKETQKIIYSEIQNSYLINFIGFFDCYYEDDFMILYYSGKSVVLSTDKLLITKIEEILNFNNHMISRGVIADIFKVNTKKEIQNIIKLCQKLEILK